MSLRDAVEKSFAAFATGDIDTAMAQLAPDAVMIEGGDNIRTGQYRGHQAIATNSGAPSDTPELDSDQGGNG